MEAETSVCVNCAKVGAFNALCAECARCAGYCAKQARLATSAAHGAAGGSGACCAGSAACADRAGYGSPTYRGETSADSATCAARADFISRTYLGAISATRATSATRAARAGFIDHCDLGATSADSTSRTNSSTAKGGISAEEKVLLAAPPHLFQQFVNSIEQFRSAAVETRKALLSKELSAFVFTLDSGSETHLITLNDAEKLFGAKGVSNLKVIGVNGSSRAEFKGKLIIRVQNQESGEVYLLDLGYGHAMRELPDNLLSVALLIKSGAVVHFEQGASYFQAHAHAAKLPLHQDGGLFQLFGGSHLTRTFGSVDQKVVSVNVNGEGVSSAVSKSFPKSFSRSGPADQKEQHAYSIEGRSYAASGDLRLWHKRIRHLSMKILRIF